MIRVLVVDDSPTARALLVAILRRDPEIVVVGEGCTGREAVALTATLRPNLVLLDVHMPDMDGFAATKEIMTTTPTPIVLITGSTQPRDVEVAVLALRAGAVAVLTKPHGPSTPGHDEEANKLITTVKTMAPVRVVRQWRREPRPHPVRPAGPGRIVTIATSTGGPTALQCVLEGLPGDFPVPILIVQHITPGFTDGFASWLNTVCDLRVKLAEQGESLRPQQVYLAPDGHHLGVSRGLAVALSDAAPIGGFRPSGTFLFESAARAYGPGAVGVILTGMGEDGVAGLRVLRQMGGRIIAQDEKTSVVNGMPGAAVAAGLPDLVLPLDAIAPRLVDWIQVASR